MFNTVSLLTTESLGIYAAVMIHDDKRKLISLKEAAKLFPTRPSRNTVQFWCFTGIRNPHTGKVHTLRSELHGGRRFTCVEWYEEWQEKVNAGRDE